MCLEKVYTQPDKNGNFVGFKVMQRTNKGITFPCYFKIGIGGEKITVPLKRWLTASNNKSNSIYGDIEYKAAFHIFLCEDDARVYMQYPSDIVVQVNFKEIVAIGEDNNVSGSLCVVAKKMKLVEILD